MPDVSPITDPELLRQIVTLQEQEIRRLHQRLAQLCTQLAALYPLATLLTPSYQELRHKVLEPLLFRGTRVASTLLHFVCYVGV